MAQPTQTDPQFKLRLPLDLKQRIEVAAASSNRSMNAEIVKALESVYPAAPFDHLLLDEFLERYRKADSGSQAKLLGLLQDFLRASGSTMSVSIGDDGEILLRR
ncbi:MULTISPECIES: Arc family DNA-binding protein [unclassified Haematobacter]|uniref:Arc family DNA-binding protein n=1 Tax=unclassified Haematobacter TaxID=2640585 RepID=UPI0025BB5247|nr:MULTISPECIES: Arc family DNA-binding protein [unclassified Haematobacter]